MASEIFTTAGLCIVLTLLGVALGYGILRVTQGGAEE
ncbi:MAG: PetM family cytochrome b6-f complex subunit 7 [Thermostichus sp. DG_1_6_bins_120]